MALSTSSPNFLQSSVILEGYISIPSCRRRLINHGSAVCQFLNGLTGFLPEANNLMTSQSSKKFSGGSAGLNTTCKKINGNEAGALFLISYVNHVVLLLTSIFLE